MLKKRFSNIEDGLDYVNIGSGICLHDFVWENIENVKGYNMAVAPEDFRYDARIINHYAKNIKKGGIVLAMVCPLSFGRNDYLYKNYFSAKYIDILPRENVSLSDRAYRMYKSYPFIYKMQTFGMVMKGYKAGAVRRIRKLFRGISYNMSDVIVEGWIKDNKPLVDLKDETQAKFFEKIFLEKQNDLINLVDIVYKNGLKPVVIVPPISKTLFGKMTEEFLEAFLYTNLRCLENKEVLILDYLKDKDFSADINYSNYLFLTSHDAKRFTSRVLDDIDRYFAKEG